MSDAEALIVHQSASILHVGNNVALRTPGNLWLIYDDNLPTCRADLSEMVRDARIANGGDPGNNDPSANALKSLVNNLIGRARRGAFRRVNRSEFDRNPIVPFTDGSHLHLDHRRAETCRCSLDDKLTLDHGWEIPPPDWSITTDPDILSHFGPELLEELAQRTWGPDKTCDFLLSPHAGVGKFTLSTVLAETLPGLVYRIDASELKDQRMAFSVHTKPLTNCRIVMYDEAARAGVKWTNTLYSMTDEDIDVNDKHRLEERLRRIGTPVFIGPDQPDLDAGQQGIAARVGAVWQLKAASGSVDATRRALWLSDTEKAKLRTWLLEVALRGPRNNDALDDHGAQEQFLDDATDDLLLDAREVLAHLDPAELYSLEYLKNQLVLADVELPDGDDKAIRGAFPGANSKKRRRLGQRQEKPSYLWLGVGLPKARAANPPAETPFQTDDFWHWVAALDDGDDPRGDFIRDTRWLLENDLSPGTRTGRAAQPARHEHHLLICEWLGHNLDGERCHDCHDLDDGRCQRDGAQDWMNSWEAAGRPLRLTASRISPDK